jgi:hypothetical protein
MDIFNSHHLRMTQIIGAAHNLEPIRSLGLSRH